MGAPISRKQALIEKELEAFRQRNRQDLADLPHDLHEILTVIHQRVFDPELNVNEVREQCQLRNHNISTRFRWVMGISIKQYIEALRMEAAARLLGCSDAEVYFIAMHVGYSHVETFNRAFRRWFDCSPSQYRRNNPPTETERQANAEAAGILLEANPKGGRR